MASSVPKSPAKICAVCSPTKRMPSALSRRASPRDFDASIARSRLATLFSPIRGRPPAANPPRARRRRRCRAPIRAASTARAKTSPKPLDVHRAARGKMPKALGRLARDTTRSCSATSLRPADDRRRCRRPGSGPACESTRSLPVRSAITGPTTRGITSPARTTITVSPIRISLLSIYAALCSVALRTVTPPICTGSRTAFGLSVPVRPTVTPTSTSFVRASRALNLNAIAQRGSRATAPSFSCSAKSSTLTTTPSIS